MQCCFLETLCEGCSSCWTFCEGSSGVSGSSARMSQVSVDLSVRVRQASYPALSVQLVHCSVLLNLQLVTQSFKLTAIKSVTLVTMDNSWSSETHLWYGTKAGSGVLSSICIAWAAQCLLIFSLCGSLLWFSCKGSGGSYLWQLLLSYPALSVQLVLLENH